MFNQKTVRKKNVSSRNLINNNTYKYFKLNHVKLPKEKKNEPKKMSIFEHTDIRFRTADNDDTEDIITPRTLNQFKKPTNAIELVSVYTDKGRSRPFNEDRVCIMLNVENSMKDKFNYFGIFDGHAGSTCSEYLKDTLHKKILNDKLFFVDIKKNFERVFKKVDEKFLAEAFKREDKSGSCAIVGLFYDGFMYFANVGDSRAVEDMLS